MSEVQMTFEVEAELRETFQSHVKANDRKPGEVLRELMRDYVARSLGEAKDVQGITAEESQRRAKAVQFATASVGLEGFKQSKAEQEHASRFIRGELNLEQYVKGDREPARGR